jgi:hypothetical protein
LQELVVRGEQDVFLTLSCQQYKLIEDLFTAELLACKDMLPSWHRRVLWWYSLRGGLSQCSVHVGWRQEGVIHRPPCWSRDEVLSPSFQSSKFVWKRRLSGASWRKWSS